MKTAIWVIAICEIVRAVQNALQLLGFKSEKRMRENAYQEFVKSLKSTDREFVKSLLEDFLNQEDSNDT